MSDRCLCGARIPLSDPRVLEEIDIYKCGVCGSDLAIVREEERNNA